MGTLDDKLLGEKIHNYCSSSEDEDESYQKTTLQEPSELDRNSAHCSTGSHNTGPKGVIKDWQRFKQLESEKREEAERERLELIKKLSITAKTTEEDEKQKQEEMLDAELDELLNDDLLLEFQKKRMAEMLQQSNKIPVFGSLINLTNGDQLLNAVDQENKCVTIIIHIYEAYLNSCKILNACLAELAKEYKHVKFCNIQSNCVRMSNKFKQHGLPALLVYKNGQLIGNFIRLSDELGDQFYASDVESFLIEHALLPSDKFFIPTLANNQNDEDDE